MTFRKASLVFFQEVTLIKLADYRTKPKGHILVGIFPAISDQPAYIPITPVIIIHFLGIKHKPVTLRLPAHFKMMGKVFCPFPSFGRQFMSSIFHLLSLSFQYNRNLPARRD